MKKTTVTITYTSLTTLIDALSDAPATAESIIDQAINFLVACGATIDNLTGDAESKTGTYTQAQAGAILTMATAIYASTYLTSGGSSSNVNLGPASLSQSSSSSAGAGSLFELADKLARKLATVSNDPPLFVSNDPVPTS